MKINLNDVLINSYDICVKQLIVIYDDNGDYVAELREDMNDKAVEYMQRKGWTCPHFRKTEKAKNYALKAPKNYKEIKERISSMDVRDNVERRAYEIALLSLEVEPDEREAYELFMEKRFGDLVDRRRAKNGDNEYMAWDMTLGWIVWQQRAGIHFSTMSQQEVK